MTVPKEDIKMDKRVDLLKNAEDDGTFLDTMYNLYFYIGLAIGVDDIRNGRGITLEEFDKESEALYEYYSRRFS